MTERLKQLLALDELALMRELAKVIWPLLPKTRCGAAKDKHVNTIFPFGSGKPIRCSLFVDDIPYWAFQIRGMIEDGSTFGEAAWELSKLVCPATVGKAKGMAINFNIPFFMMGYAWLSSDEAEPRHWIIVEIVTLEKKGSTK